MGFPGPTQSNNGLHITVYRWLLRYQSACNARSLVGNNTTARTWQTSRSKSAFKIQNRVFLGEAFFTAVWLPKKTIQRSRSQGRRFMLLEELIHCLHRRIDKAWSRQMRSFELDKRISRHTRINDDVWTWNTRCRCIGGILTLLRKQVLKNINIKSSYGSETQICWYFANNQGGRMTRKEISKSSLQSLRTIETLNSSSTSSF